MNTKQKIMGLAALPLAGLLATGGVALAQTAGHPAGTQVVQQAATHRPGDPCPVHPANTAAQQQGDQLRLRDRDRDGTCDHPALQTANRTMERAHDGSCVYDTDQ